MLFEQLGITKKDDITHDLKPNQMKKNSQNMVKIITLIDTTKKPFSEKFQKNTYITLVPAKQYHKRLPIFCSPVSRLDQMRRIL